MNRFQLSHVAKLYVTSGMYLVPICFPFTSFAPMQDLQWHPNKGGFNHDFLHSPDSDQLFPLREAHIVVHPQFSPIHAPIYPWCSPAANLMATTEVLETAVTHIWSVGPVLVAATKQQPIWYTDGLQKLSAYHIHRFRLFSLKMSKIRNLIHYQKVIVKYIGHLEVSTNNCLF